MWKSIRKISGHTQPYITQIYTMCTAPIIQKYSHSHCYCAKSKGWFCTLFNPLYFTPIYHVLMHSVKKHKISSLRTKFYLSCLHKQKNNSYMGRWRQPVCLTHHWVPDYTMANPEDSSLCGILKCHSKSFLLYSFNEILKM